ncbi:MAG: GNAT family N-acetyltransferase [Ilumatobacter sp.]
MSDSTDRRIVIDDLSGVEIQALLRRHGAGMLADSPPDACHFLDVGGLRDPSITVWSVWDEGALAGCGALRELNDHHGEVKSMRTADEHLGKGVGRAVLERIIDVAASRGYRKLSLETGTGPSFDAAVHLYESVGFVPTGPFGDYSVNDFSRFFDLTIG